MADDLASCEGPYTASSSSEGQNSLVKVEVEPYCQVDKGAHPALVQVLAEVLNLVKDLEGSEAAETADFVMPGCVVVATAAVASEAVPKERNVKIKQRILNIINIESFRPFPHRHKIFSSKAFISIPF